MQVAAAAAALAVPGAALARLAAMNDPATAAAAPSLQDPELRRILSAYFEGVNPVVPASAAAAAAAEGAAEGAAPASKALGAKAAFLRADIKVRASGPGWLRQPGRPCPLRACVLVFDAGLNNETTLPTLPRGGGLLGSVVAPEEKCGGGTFCRVCP